MHISYMSYSDFDEKYKTYFHDTFFFINLMYSSNKMYVERGRYINLPP